MSPECPSERIHGGASWRHRGWAEPTLGHSWASSAAARPTRVAPMLLRRAHRLPTWAEPDDCGWPGERSAWVLRASPQGSGCSPGSADRSKRRIRDRCCTEWPVAPVRPRPAPTQSLSLRRAPIPRGRRKEWLPSGLLGSAGALLSSSCSPFFGFPKWGEMCARHFGENQRGFGFALKNKIRTRCDVSRTDAIAVRARPPTKIVQGAGPLRHQPNVIGTAICGFTLHEE